ncbi:MAG: TlpA family protein disulfide reductase [Chitinophagaceae bacterium]
MAQKNTTSITIKTKPYAGTTFWSYSNLKVPYSLHKANFPLADEKGVWKIEYESNDKIIINFTSYLLANNNFTFLAEKGYDYVISKDDFNPVHRLQDDSLFINEFNVINHLDEEFGIFTSPEISTDPITYWEKGTIKVNSDSQSDTAWKTLASDFKIYNSHDFNKPVATEAAFFKKCDEINKYRNYVLDSAYKSKLISKGFYDYFKTYFRVKYIDDKFSIIPDRYLREALKVPLSLDTNFNATTRRILKDNDFEIEKLFKCDECVQVAGFSHLIEDYLYKKIFNESKYRTIMEEIFDYVVKSNDFSSKVKNMFLFTLVHHNKAIKDKVKNYPKILEKFYKTCTDSYYTNLLKTEISERNFSLNENDLKNTFLFNEYGMKTSLKSILDNHKGKYIYIDMWGSNYKLSTEHLNNAKDLYNVTSTKDFTVLFFGFESNFKNWKNTQTKYTLPNNNSYFWENAFETPLARRLGITFLQRYVIFDKEGKLIESNATWPDDMLGKKYYED